MSHEDNIHVVIKPFLVSPQYFCVKDGYYNANFLTMAMCC